MYRGLGGTKSEDILEDVEETGRDLDVCRDVPVQPLNNINSLCGLVLLDYWTNCEYSSNIWNLDAFESIIIIDTSPNLVYKYTAILNYEIFHCAL